MVWGDMSAAPRWNPARNAYGPTSSVEEQREALEVSLAAGVNLLDTAAMYGKGASERRVGELTEGKQVLVATKFPAGFFSRAGSLPATLDASLARLRRPVVDLYQVHFPSRWMSIPALMNLMARVQCDVDDRDLTTVECRPPWGADSGSEWTRFPIARLRYTKTRKTWSLYWRDRNLRFRQYDRVQPSGNVEDLLAELDRDPTSIFWG